MQDTRQRKVSKGDYDESVKSLNEDRGLVTQDQHDTFTGPCCESKKANNKSSTGCTRKQICDKCQWVKNETCLVQNL